MLWSGPPRRLIELASEGEAADLYSSAVLLEEVGHALGYPKFTSRIAAFGTNIDALAARVCG